MDVDLNTSKEITLALEQAKHISKTSAPNIKKLDALDNDTTTLLSFEDKKLLLKSLTADGKIPKIGLILH